jgi:cytochrome c2
MRDALLALVLLTTSCSTWGQDDPSPAAHRLTGGSAERGRRAVLHYGCHACHEIPGVPGARATIGPSLKGIASRSTLAGHYATSTSAMLTWIQHPQEMLPGNVMPDMGVSEADARDLTAYLFTLR